MTDRPLRLCDVCYELDDHPRHVLVGPRVQADAGVEVDYTRVPDGTPPAAVGELANPNSTVRHLNCCAAAGCPICQETETLTVGARGADLIRAITEDGALDGFDPGNG